MEPQVENDQNSTPDNSKLEASNELKYSSSGKIRRPNERLLRLAKLNLNLNISDEGSPKLNTNKESQNVCLSESRNELPAEVPPPSYDSVVKVNCEINSIYALPSSSQLPRYEDVGGLSDAPPSYHSIFTGSMFRVIHPFNTEADSVINYSEQQVKFPSLLANILIFVFLISFVIILPVSMIVMGILYVGKCPVQPRLPIYLIVLGFFQMLECCGRLAVRFFQNQNTHLNETWRDRYRRKDPLIYFVIVWFIIGSMWVYQTDPFCKGCIKGSSIPAKYNLTGGNGTSTISTVKELHVNRFYLHVTCDKTIYAFAFWVVTSYYSVIAFFFLLVLFDVLTRIVSRCCCPVQQVQECV